MTEEIIDYYNTELSFKAIMAKHYVAWRKILNLLFYISLGLAISFLLTSKVLFIVGAFALFVSTMFLIVYLNAKTIKKLYPSMYISNFSWSYFKLQRMISARLKEKFIELGIQNKEQIKQISDLVKMKANKEKTPYIIFASTFGIVFAPIWYSFIVKVFDLVNKNITHLFVAFMASLVIAFTISVPFSMLTEIRDNILTKHNDLNKLSEVIDDIYLQW